jgi:excisionase family DNA binding protein
MTASHTLYRFFDADGALLYVGRTIAPARRWREHERHSDWFADVATVTRIVYPDAASLADAEREAIREECPLHNVQLAIPALEPAPDYPVRLLYRISEFAKIVGVPESRIVTLVRNGVIESVKIGRSRRIPAECLTDYVERLKASA